MSTAKAHEEKIFEAVGTSSGPHGFFVSARKAVTEYRGLFYLKNDRRNDPCTIPILRPLPGAPERET